MNLFAVIMAGGHGERFWPMGRLDKPKQLLRLVSDSTMIEETVQRLFPLIPPENIIVITNQHYVQQIQEVLVIPSGNVIGEPEAKDTAPCVALAVALIKRRAKGESATMVLLPADHVIKPAKALQQTIMDCVEVAQSGSLVTIGIKPTEPATGYGYIQCGNELKTECSTKFNQVLSFREKPDIETAKGFLASSNFYWNSGMFIWQVDSIVAEFQKQTKEFCKMIKNIESASDSELDLVIKDEFSRCQRISIDYAIMENATNVSVAESSFTWSDIGSWAALREQFPADTKGNVCQGLTALTHDTSNCIVVGESDHLIGVIGMENTAVVHSGNAMLVCPITELQRVKELVATLKERGLDDYY